MPFRRRKYQNLPPPLRTRSSPRSHSSPPYCPHEDHRLPLVNEDPYRSPVRLRGSPVNPLSSPTPMVVRRPSQPSSTPSPRTTDPAAPELLQTLSDLTVALTSLTHNQVEEAVPVGPPADPDFDWKKLLLVPPTSFPTATEGQVQLLAEGLLARLPSLRGRDSSEVTYALSVASQYPVLDAEAQNVVYQRLNLLYIAVHHGWSEAVAASSASAAVLPPGYQLSPRLRSRDKHHSLITD